MRVFEWLAWWSCSSTMRSLIQVQNRVWSILIEAWCSTKATDVPRLYKENFSDSLNWSCLELEWVPSSIRLICSGLNESYSLVYMKFLLFLSVFEQNNVGVVWVWKLFLGSFSSNLMRSSPLDSPDDLDCYLYYDSSWSGLPCQGS